MTEREDWPVHRPYAPEAPIPGIHHYSACSPDYPRVQPDGTCEDCGGKACPECGLELCSGHVGPGMVVKREFGHWPEHGLEAGDWWAYVVRDGDGRFVSAHRRFEQAREHAS